MRGDNLKTHMKKHERGNEEGTTLNNVKGINHEEMEKTILSEMKEFERKIEMGRFVKTVVNKHSLNVNGLERAKKDALDTYELHGKNIDSKDNEWRGWQMDLRQYLDKPCDRKVIWVVGMEGNEGKSFFKPI